MKCANCHTLKESLSKTRSSRAATTINQRNESSHPGLWSDLILDCDPSDHKVKIWSHPGLWSNWSSGEDCSSSSSVYSAWVRPCGWRCVLPEGGDWNSRDQIKRAKLFCSRDWKIESQEIKTILFMRLKVFQKKVMRSNQEIETILFVRLKVFQK